MPGGVFNRGFVRAYAQFIGVDPDAMVNGYLLQEQAQSGRAPTERHLLRRVTSSRGLLSNWLRWGLLALILLAIAVGLYFVLRLATGGTAGGGDRPVQDGARSHVASTAPPPVAVGSGEDSE